MSGTLVVKFGGELLEDPARLQTAVAAVAAIARRSPLVIVHGGGKEIDAALEAAGIEKRQVEGVRVTDPPTLDVVISVLGGIINTRFVAALTSAGVAAVGITGADAGCGVVTAAGPHRTTDGQLVDLGRVGVPDQAADGRLLTTLVTSAFVPVIASIGLGVDGRLYNVNADTFAGDVAARLKARRLVIAGTTPGVLDRTGATIATLDRAAMTEMIDSGAATAGMIAKLRACEAALSAGVGDVVIVDGRDGAALEAAALGNVLDEAPGAAAYETLAGGPLTATRLVAATGVGRESWPR